MSARKARRRAGKAAQEAQRAQIFGAIAVITCARFALDSQLEGIDRQHVIDALAVRCSMT